MTNNDELVPTSNKLAIIQVLAALIQEPKLIHNDNYTFTMDDFPEQFHRILFGAIDHLARNNMESIGYIDIDQFLKQYPIQYKVFCENNGVSYIQNCIKIYNKDKFEYYYKTLKKYSLINALQKDGINTSDIYNPDIIDPKKCVEMQEKFDKYTIDDILQNVENRFTKIKDSFYNNSDRVENKMGEGIEELVDELMGTPIMGLPLMSPKLTTIYRGMRKGCVYMTSAGSGSGKTRLMVGEAVNLSIGEFYDTIKNEWIKTDLHENVLIIETELELQEVQTMVLAAISGVAESKIMDGKYYGNEEERVRKAARLVKSSNLYMVAITNYDTDDLISVIKTYHTDKNVDYVFYDYLSENLKILAEGARKSRVSGLRTDQILLSMITALKDCAKQNNIYIATATQLSGDFKNSKELDASYLRSAKSLSDKIDVGAILMPVREEIDRSIIDAYLTKGFETEPNFVISVYKIRRGTYQNIKVYIYFDRGTCRISDCFVTNNKGELLPIADTNVELILDTTKESSFTTAFTNGESEVYSDDDLDFDF